MVIDTETCPLDRSLTDVRPDNMWCYDIGWAIADKRGNVYKTRSFVNADIFLDEKELMKSAYYANKVPQYWKDIKAGKRILTSFYKIQQAFWEDIKEYEVTEFFAHNMRFDYGTLNNTIRWLTKSKYRYFFPYKARVCDTLKMARDVFGTMPTYIRFCENNGYVTQYGKPRFTAEIIYRFLTQDTEFVENHTGLEDVMIETKIMAYCYKSHKKMRVDLWDQICYNKVKLKKGGCGKHPERSSL